MPGSFRMIELDRIKTQDLVSRKSKVNIDDFARTWEKSGRFSDFFDRLPDILAGRDLKQVVWRITKAANSGAKVILGMGAHVIKVGLNPILIDLLERGVITGLAMNGACIIHDLELAMAGKTSEDVAEAMDKGVFGMSEQTAEAVIGAIKRASEKGIGLGEAVGEWIIQNKPPFSDHSLVAAGYRLKVPVTIHLAIGTDIVHMHPGFDAGAAGEASHRDFRIFAQEVAGLEGGVFLNVGSAVILPEIFLKALSVARNLGYRVDDFTAVNLDFIRHYRPLANVVERPTRKGGTGIHITGHHEIMLPLIAAGVIEMLE